MTLGLALIAVARLRAGASRRRRPSPLSRLRPAAQPPRPFPEGSKFALIDIQRVASESTEGKASTARMQALNQKKVAELNDLNKKLRPTSRSCRQQTR